MGTTDTTVIVEGARTPIGRFLGALAPLGARELGAHAIRHALERSGVDPADVDAVFLGNVVQAGVGPNVARLAAVDAGVPLAAPATTLNKLCLSGLASIATADLHVRAGLATAAVAGGTESMTNAPHELPSARRGFRYGPADLVDSLERDALVCGIEGTVMGAGTERHQRGRGITREAQDAFALRSHQRASAAAERGDLAAEIAPIGVPGRGGERTVAADEGVRGDTTLEALAALRPAFDPDGTITAGSSSPLSDGACAVVVMSRAEAERRGLEWLAEIVSYGTVAGPDPSLLDQPANALRAALARTDLSVADLDVVEINEAFASVALASTAELGLDPDVVNPNGGAIALGHPVGMSGARIVLALAHELRRRGGGLGAATLCGGGGQGDALVLRV